MRPVLSPIALLAIVVSAMPLSPKAAPAMPTAARLNDGALAAVHIERPQYPVRSALPPSGDLPTRSRVAEQTDVWMTEQGVSMILDAARPVPTGLAAARR